MASRGRIGIKLWVFKMGQNQIDQLSVELESESGLSILPITVIND